MTELQTITNRKKILIVDDDEMHLEIARELIQNEEFEVITHRNGFGVLDRVKTLQPDLVLIDINMPGLSGDRLAAMLHNGSETGHVPIVFYSSNDEHSLREFVSTCDVQGYICKGDYRDLRNKVAEYLSNASAKNAHHSR